MPVVIIIAIITLIIYLLLGFSIGTFKIPDSSAFKFTQKTGGENIDDVIKRAIMFRIKNKNKVYIYKEMVEEEDKK